MRKRYIRLFDDEKWLVREIEFTPELQNIRESQFAIGNGLIGSRGVFEEMPRNARPGTYFAGVFDALASQVTELVNFPNPFHFYVTVNGEKLGVETMDFNSHRRFLNLKKGVIVRYTEYTDHNGNRFDYSSVRFLSMRRKNVGVMQIVVKPCTDNCIFEINGGIDTGVNNTGTLTEGDKKHFRISELGRWSNCRYLVLETLQKKHNVIYFNGIYYEIKGKRKYANDDIFKVAVPKNEIVVFTKVVYLKACNYAKSNASRKNKAYKSFKNTIYTPFEELLDSHISAWKKLWDNSDIKVYGTFNLQQNLRFNIYHMLICQHYDNGCSSIGARTLSGEGYRGHVFWDSEVFLFPFYLYTNPRVAKNMLLYRYKRLDRAREIAAANGYQGAMFPWESADEGREETPEWAKDIDGRVVKIYTNKMEHHITAEIAYSVYRYFQATDDKQFMREYGYELLAECARFWASRVTFNKKSAYYEIKDVIGPDEFHIGVNNNAFTNLMAKWTLISSVRLLNKYHKEYPKNSIILRKKMSLKTTEIRKWRHISARVKKINTDSKGVIEQFDGYFKLRNIKLKELDENGIPLLPSHVNTEDMGKTKLVKQADVVMAMAMLPDIFNSVTKKVNHEYYLPKTVHKSSLSPSICSTVAAQSKDVFRAYHFFNVSLRSDISNLYGNTHEGIHAASLGGTWQAMIFGFAGLCIDTRRNIIMIDPVIPRTWNGIVFYFRWKGCLLKFDLGHDKVRVVMKSSRRKTLEMKIFNKIVTVEKNKKNEYKRRKKQRFDIFY